MTTRSRTSAAAESDFLPSDISYEPYGLVMRRDDPDFRLAVNRALVERLERLQRVLHGGKTTHLWSIEVREKDTDRLICTGKHTVMVLQKK